MQSETMIAFIELTRDHALQARYIPWCFVSENQVTIDRDINFLDLAVKPENTHLSVDTANTSAVLLGSTVIFNCTTSSHPKPHIYWFYHNQELLGSNISGVYYLQVNTSGVYSCLPVSNAGVGETASVNLTVVGKLLN